MKKGRLLSICTAILILICSCSSLSPQPTITPTITSFPSPTIPSTSTHTPTDTPQPSHTVTSTRTPTYTQEPPTLTATPELLLKQPQDTPVLQWRGISIMPGAIAGEEDDNSYAFVISESHEQVQSFYEKEMASLGWGLMAVGEGETGSLLLMFTKGSMLMSISVILQENGTTYVLIIQT